MIKYFKGYILAKRHKMPFRIEKHWQFSPTKIKGFKTLRFIERFECGKTVVDLFSDEKYTYQYLITDYNSMRGSDWIGSNLEFWLIYVGRTLKNNP